MPVQAERIARDIQAIATCTPNPGQGSDRPTFSPHWRKARDYVIAEATKAGCHHRVDAAGNVHLRQKSVDWSKPCWLAGSHLDSVPGGGDYDGVLGVVAALEVLRAAAEDKNSSFPWKRSSLPRRKAPPLDWACSVAVAGWEPWTPRPWPS